MELLSSSEFLLGKRQEQSPNGEEGTSLWRLVMTQPVWLMVKSPPAMQETWETLVRSLGQEGPLGKGMRPTPVFSPGESRGWRSLEGYSSEGLKESDSVTEVSEVHTMTPQLRPHPPWSLGHLWHFCFQLKKLMESLKAGWLWGKQKAFPWVLFQ